MPDLKKCQFCIFPDYNSGKPIIYLRLCLQTTEGCLGEPGTNNNADDITIGILMQQQEGPYTTEYNAREYPQPTQQTCHDH